MNTGRALIGTALLALGALLLLDQGGVLDAGEVVADWWPVLFLLAGGLELLARPARRIAAAVYGAIGVVLLALTTGAVDASVWELVWPSAFILLGVWLLVRPALGDRTVSAGDIDVTAVFAGRRLVSTAAPFRRGTATAVFGGVEIDLTGASLAPDATLDAVALFGGVDVTVPLGWRVVIDGPAIFGGHDDKVPAPSDPDAPTLKVRATAIFGGVEVKADTGVAYASHR